MSGLGVFAGVWAATLPLAFLANFTPPTFVPKYSLMLLAAAVGVVPLARLIRDPRLKWAAGGAVGFLLVAGLSAALSAAPNLGLFGLYQWGTGWLFWLACAGAFSIGTQLSATDRRWAFYGLVAGAIGNAAIAVYQIVGKPTIQAFMAYPGNRADGLLGSPIHLEALLLGAIAIVASTACRSLRHWWWVLLLFGVSTEFTSERLAILFLVAIFAVVIVRHGRRGAIFSVIVAAGFVIGYLGGGAGLGTRVTSGTTSTTFALRGHIWQTAITGMSHHLLLGGGPGQFLGATAPYIDARFAKQLGSTLFTDAHDWAVEVLATTGLLGALFFAVWILGFVRLARGPFLAFGAATLGVELVEPLNIGVTPLAFLALGCAVAASGNLIPRLGEVARTSSSRVPLGRVVTVSAVLAAVGLAGPMLVGDYFYSTPKATAIVATDPERANSLLPYWPETAVALAFDVWEPRLELAHDRAQAARDLRNMQYWYVQSANRDPAEPSTWSNVALVAAKRGDRRGEGSAWRRALQDYPFMTAALLGLAQVDENEHAWHAAVTLYERLEAVDSRDPVIERDLLRARSHIKR